MLIKEVKAREILDSRGVPTVEVDLITNSDLFRVSVPSGTSTGKYEAVELRDGGKRYNGMGVLKAVENIRKKISPKLKYLSPLKQKEIDDLLIKIDGTKNKSKLGANAILAVSIAVCKAGAAENNTSLFKYIKKISGNKNKLFMPSTMILVFEGGKHADKSSDLQEFMIISKEKRFIEALRKSSEVYGSIKEILKNKKFNTNVGYEGAYPSPFIENEKVFDIILEGIKKAGYKDNDFNFAIDVAASEFCDKKNYILEGRKRTKEDIINFYYKLNKSYPLISIEDPFDQEDIDSWKTITESVNKDIMIVGDDLLATNPDRVRNAISKKLCNALLVKPNQIGTVSEAINAVNIAKNAGWKIVVSHRSGETEDNFIADFAIGVGADYVKFGSLSRGERTAKYNQLIRIYEEIF